MKQNATNEFKDGLNLDLHPIVTPNTVLTDNLNGTFITYNGNEFCLQNDRGNEYVTSLSEGYIPIGIKEYNGILYIVSVNGNKTEIGTYPSLENTSSDDASFYNIDLRFEYKDVIDGNGQKVSSAYKPLRIGEGHSYFTNVDLGYRITTPVTIEIQDSYDGSVNLILVADEVPTKIINSGFSKKSDSIGRWIKRNQKEDTNVYHISDLKTLNQEINLIRTSDELTNINLSEVQAGGQFKGGNYTFYIKFGDADYNQTDVVAESGIVSIFNGNDGVPSTISGTLADERTDKMIHLEITGLNHVYSKIYIYYSREYSDTQGYRMTEYGMFNDPIDMIRKEDEETFESGGKGQSIWLTGFEQMVPINSEELNVDYHTIDWARAESQHSNMLFLGNVGQKATFYLYDRLKDFSKKITPSYSQSSLTPVSIDYTSGKEYYSVHNIYNKVGYYPGEIYRFGIVYILKDGSKTPVFNTKGINFQTGDALSDGVVLMPNVDIITEDEIKPLYLTFTVPEINEPDVIGWFIVRQKRIPNTICEGLSIATDAVSNTPMMWDGENWVTQSFLASDRENTNEIVYLEYNSAQSEIEITPSTTFKDWFVKNRFKYVPKYWLYLGESNTYYYLNNSYNWNESQTKAQQVKDAIESIVDSLNLGRDYSVFVSLAGEEDSLLIDEQWEMLNNREPVLLYWHQKYELTNVDEETKIPTDSATTEYVVGIISDLQEYDSIPVGTENSILYNSWKKQYERINNANSTLDRKFIKNTIPFGKESNAILSLDPCVVPQVGSRLDGSKFYIDLERTLSVESKTDGKYKNVFTTQIEQTDNEFNVINEKCAYIPSNTAVKVIDTYEFSNVAGNASEVSQFKALSTPFFMINGVDGPFDSDAALNEVLKILNNNLKELVEQLSKTDDPNKKREYLGGLYSLLYANNKNVNLLRGLFTPYIGITNNAESSEFPFGVYSIKNKESLNKNDFLVRQQDSSEYYCVSEYTNKSTINVYRGDCFTNTVSMRMIRNFIDTTAPIADIILDPDAWHNYVVTRDKEATKDTAKVSYADVNLSDVNTVDLGYWVTFKCLSSYNLGLRSIDTFHEDETALLGSPRSFYPLNGASTATGNKMEESYLLNDGLSATVGRKRYNLMPDVPYSKSEFSNRIMFSNINVTDSFTNGYRTFQGLAYKDYDKQYGAITKLISLGRNIFIIMEHGLGLVPVNPKALMQTTTGETIHIYGYGVLPDEMTIISQDYGSKYEHSVIRTPIGIYGIDVDAKKIWRFSNKQGFETISDMRVETYLKDNLKSQEIEMGNSDIRTHYNRKKGDLMFTWYRSGEVYSICYNERRNLWVTRYNWTPIVSENVNDEFYSLNENAIWDHSDFATHNGHVSSWYENDKGFEFEFVVSDPIGINKIYENLQIISNNVQPNEMEISIIGDDYEFKRIPTPLNEARSNRPEVSTWNPNIITTTSNIHGQNFNTSHWTYHFDRRLNQSAIVKWQPFKDIYKFGRRIGNIQYKDGIWFAQIEPLLINASKEARIKDKWAKIRIRYSGKDLAIITAIRTLINV